MDNQKYRYVMIPLNEVPENPSYEVWFGTWSQDTKNITWSHQRPGASSAWATAVAAYEVPPVPPDVPSQGVTILGDGSKCVPPPPLTLSGYPSSPALDALRKAFTQWLITIRDTRSV